MIPRALLPVLAAFALNTSVSICAEAPFHDCSRSLSEVISLAAVPADVAIALGRPIVGLKGIADRGEPFNATDIVETDLPMRRFVVGGISDDYVIVAVEIGGRGHTLSAIAFTRVDSKWTETQTWRWNWHDVGRPDNLEALLRLVCDAST